MHQKRLCVCVCVADKMVCVVCTVLKIQQVVLERCLSVCQYTQVRKMFQQWPKQWNFSFPFYSSLHFPTLPQGLSTAFFLNKEY